jgi:hypothetical protein
MTVQKGQTMPASLARIDTARADRYLAQICDHLGHLPHASRHDGQGSGHNGPPQILNIDRTDDQAVITFPWGTCTLQATAGTLLVRVEARDDTALGQAEALIAQRIHTIGSRDHLSVDWQRDPLS